MQNLHLIRRRRCSILAVRVACSLSFSRNVQWCVLRLPSKRCSALPFCPCSSLLLSPQRLTCRCCPIGVTAVFLFVMFVFSTSGEKAGLVFVILATFGQVCFLALLFLMFLFSVSVVLRPYAHHDRPGISSFCVTQFTLFFRVAAWKLWLTI